MTPEKLTAGPVPAQDDAERKVRALLWNAYPICCGNVQGGEWHMGMREPDQCCGSPDMDMLGDADIVKALRELFPEQASPHSVAVAQPVPAGPVPDPKHALQFLEQYGKNLEAAGFSSGDALKACQIIFETKVSPSPAVAQPVADERVPCEACYGIGSSAGNFDGADGGDCYVCDGMGKVLAPKNERVRFEIAHAGMDLERMSDKDGGYYIHRITQAKWEAWQARATLRQPAEEGDKV